MPLEFKFTWIYMGGVNLRHSWMKAVTKKNVLVLQALVDVLVLVTVTELGH